ncbi:uncharacterized protein [Battus philenor]|uniref:uncharacterized protein n=1 Tax=Battus philenor TaxID=42288 RepID=UPI0035CE8748
MNEDSVQNVRETTRELLKLNRRFYRNEMSDVQRSIQNISISPNNVLEVVQKLKSKCHISVSDLNTLKNGLMQDQKNIEVVLGSHGTMRGLVRELSGHDVKKQCASAGCCCNLALGDSRACNVVAKTAGPYLIAALDNLTTELAMTCAWALGNLAGSGPKVCDVLVAQGALTKLCDLLFMNNEDIQDAAVYALLHFAFQMEDDFRSEQINKVLSALSKIEPNLPSCQLSFVLSCHADFKDNMPEELVHKMLAALDTAARNHLKKCDHNNNCELLYVIRTLANVDEQFYQDILIFFVQNNMSSLWEILKTDNGLINESLLWLLGNLYKSCSDNIFFCEFLK